MGAPGGARSPHPQNPSSCVPTTSDLWMAVAPRGQLVISGDIFGGPSFGELGIQLASEWKKAKDTAERLTVHRRTPVAKSYPAQCQCRGQTTRPQIQRGWAGDGGWRQPQKKNSLKLLPRALLPSYSPADQSRRQERRENRRGRKDSSSQITFCLLI